MKTQTVEALKEFVRTFVLGLIPGVVAAIAVINNGINTDTGEFNIMWTVVVAVLVSNILTVFQTALLKAADKWLHKHGVETALDMKALDRLSERNRPVG